MQDILNTVRSKPIQEKNDTNYEGPSCWRKKLFSNKSVFIAVIFPQNMTLMKRHLIKNDHDQRIYILITLQDISEQYKIKNSIS